MPAEPEFAADCLQPPLVPRSSFWQLLKPSVRLLLCRPSQHRVGCVVCSIRGSTAQQAFWNSEIC